jgi:hypothetical protein
MFQDTVARAGEMIAGVVDSLDPDAVSGSAARDLRAAFDRAGRLCAAGKTLLARRVAATHQRSGGSRSAAEELARRSGSSAGAAKEALDTSARLPEQAPVEQAVRRGELSAAQAAPVSAAAAADPSQSERLADLAKRVALPELREECARVRAAAEADPEATNRRLHQGRRLRRWTDSEGFGTCTPRAPPSRRGVQRGVRPTGQNPAGGPDPPTRPRSTRRAGPPRTPRPPSPTHPATDRQRRDKTGNRTMGRSSACVDGLLCRSPTCSSRSHSSALRVPVPSRSRKAHPRPLVPLRARPPTSNRRRPRRR